MTMYSIWLPLFFVLTLVLAVRSFLVLRRNRYNRGWGTRWPLAIATALYTLAVLVWWGDPGLGFGCLLIGAAFSIVNLIVRFFTRGTRKEPAAAPETAAQPGIASQSSDDGSATAGQQTSATVSASVVSAEGVGGFGSFAGAAD